MRRQRPRCLTLMLCCVLVVGGACSTPDVPIDPETGDPMPVEQPNEVCGWQRGAGGR
jgi:hypothetical protein